MGLIQAAKGALGGILGDQWKEYFYCDAMPSNVLVRKGQKRTSSRSSNTKGEENIISSGSTIAVNDGQCMIIVEQGKVVEFCAEAGEFKWDASTEPSVFSGSLGESVVETFKNLGKRFTYGADTGKDQRIYYFNTKEIVGNKYGTPSPVPFRVVDKNIGLDVDISVKCYGEYSYKITDPLLFYQNVCGNVTRDYTRDNLDSQLRTEVLSALQPAFAEISEMGIRYSAVVAKTEEMSAAMQHQLSEKWGGLRGITIVSFSVASIKAPTEDEEMIKNLQKNAVMRDPSMAAATLVGAQSEAMRDAAKNSAGVMTGFMGMGMAQNAGGLNANSLFAMAEQKKQQNAEAGTWKCACGKEATGKFCSACGAKKPEEAPGWVCTCGKENKAESKFCPECGAKRPEEAPKGWTCPTCGAVNEGKFCAECGTKKPAEALLYKCDKCGWKPEDPANPPKFCPECGDVFNEDDAAPADVPAQTPGTPDANEENRPPMPPAEDETQP
ncbi:MAG: SPFH domain-containing protein [Clostridia bacterium]|nr:SPFH domain-containing protein [Clostridia bacterium]